MGKADLVKLIEFDDTSFNNMTTMVPAVTIKASVLCLDDFPQCKRNLKTLKKPAAILLVAS